MLLKTILITIALTVLCMKLSFSQIGIGTTTPASGAAVDIYSNTMGVLIPRMTTDSMEYIANPYNGLLVFNTDLNTYCIFDSSSATPQWVLMSPWTSEMSLNSNLTINTSANFGIGTTNSGFTIFKLKVNGRVRSDTLICSNMLCNSISVNGNINAGSINSLDTIYANSFTGIGAVPSGTLVYWELYYDIYGNPVPIPDGWVLISSDDNFCTAVSSAGCYTGIYATIVSSKDAYMPRRLIRKL